MDFFSSDGFASHVEALMSQHHVPGLAIAVVQNDQTASAGYGKASVDPPKSCTADTLFDIASASKSLTAASVALLVDDDEKYPEVRYDALMSKLLPDDFVMPEASYTEGVTVEDILSHRTGMAAHINASLGPRAAQPDDARSITRNLRNLPVAAPIRSRYLYCNLMFTVATYLVEVKSKKSFSDFLEDHFFRPLVMQSSSLQPGSALAKGFGDRMATGYCWTKETGTYHAFEHVDCPESQGAGSIVTSVNDFIKWVKALMNRESPINEKVYQGLIRMRTIVNPSASRLKPYTSPAIYAAGIEVYSYRGHMVIGHDGMTTGFASRFFFVPDFKFGAVIAGNAAEASAIGSILARELIEELLKVPEAERLYRNKGKPGNSATKISIASHPTHQVDKEKEQLNKKNNETPRGGENIPQPLEKASSGSENSQAQETPLIAYIGKYWHPGYHTLTVEIKDAKLFVDATDRSMGFTLTFDHVAEQTKYVAHLSDFLEGGDDLVPAEFVFKDGKAFKLGLQLENALKDMIWFQRVEESGQA